jgi:coenzyme F420-reducing hydrogenase delta subunit
MMDPAIRISLFHCANSISPEEVKQLDSQWEGVELDIISVPCTGKVAFEYILKSIESGSDTAIVVGCLAGECKYLQGSVRAQKRIEAVNELLMEAGAGDRCVRFIHLDGKSKSENIVNELKIHIEHIIGERATATV